MDRIDEIYNQIKNDDLQCSPNCPYSYRKECTYKQSCIYSKAIKLAFREDLAKLDDVYSFTHEYECQWLPSLYDITESLSFEYAKQIEPPSITQQITNIKSQLKHCKNPLQKLNLEREMNRLINKGDKI